MREKILRLSWEWGPDVVHERSEQRYCAIEKESWMGKGLKLGWELEPLLESNGCYALGFRRFARPGKLRQTSGRLHSRGTVDGRRPITVGGGGGYLLMGKGKSQKKMILLNPVQLRISFDLHNTIQNTFGFSFDLQFLLLIYFKASRAPVALEGRLCRSAKPHEYKRSNCFFSKKKKKGRTLYLDHT